MSIAFERSLAEWRDLLPKLEGLRGAVEAAAQCAAHCLQAGGRLLVCGNGGSAADSAHLATEFACRFCNDRRPYSAIALTADGSLLTAVGNDYAFEEVFARQVWAHGRPGDVLIVFTTSGQSRNVVRALEEAQARGLRTIAFLGRDGGLARGRAEIELLVPCTSTARIQEAHKFLLHVLCEAAEELLPKE